jgi:hypothetical protein
LNCNTIVTGRFCQNCGQENVEMKQGFWQMVKHFVYDIFHFDGKFFETLKFLIIKPGKVAKEYSEGKRERYLNPIRMYLFISAITFLLLPVFSSVERSLKGVHIIATPSERLTEASRNYQLKQAAPKDTNISANLELILDTTVYLRLKDIHDTAQNGIVFRIGDKQYKAVPIHDSVIFPKDNWLNKRASAGLKKRFKEEGEDLNKVIFSMNHLLFKMLPYLLFLSLPVFAFILKSLYNKRTFYYSDHSVFTLYHYICTFFLLLLVIALGPVFGLIHLDPFMFLFVPVFIIWLLYLLLEMKSFYKESWGKTILKFMLVSISSFAALGLLFFIFVYTLYII